jgi:hypothetical protein
MAKRQKNIWPFETTTTVYRRRGVSPRQSKATSYKGYRVWDDEDGWHTSLDPGSWFDSRKDVTRFIDSWIKGRSNPTLMSGQSSRYPGFHPNPPEGWFQRCVKAVSAKGGAYDPNAVCAAQERRRNSGPVVIGTWEYWTVGGEVYRNAVGNRGHMEDGKPSNARWESSVAHFEHFRPMLEAEAQKQNPTIGVTDRALRYRAVNAAPEGPKRCVLCGHPRKRVEVGHVNGYEEDTTPENLFWTCRSCNVLAANAMRRAGVGRLTHQYNPAGGAKSVGQWLTAVTSMKGESDAMSVPDAVAMIHATSAAKRSEYAREIWSLRKGRGNPMSDLGDSWVPIEASAPYGMAAAMKRGFESRGIATAIDKLGGRQTGKFRVYVHRTDTSAANKAYAEVAHEARESYMGKRNPLALTSLPGVASVAGKSEKWLKRHKLMNNPEAESAEAFEKFHGFPPREEIVVERDVHFHEKLWAVGELEKLTVVVLDGARVDLSGFADKKGEPAMLCGNERMTQLYIEGGDQEVDLAEFGIGEPYHDKEELGKIKKLFYFTDKSHLGDQGGEAVYHHKLGEEKKTRAGLRIVVQPTLVYDVRNKALEIIGGEYVIEPEGIRN